MKTYVHARLGPEERAQLEKLKKVTGETETALVKRGLRLVYEREMRARRSVLEVAGRLAGRYRGGPADLSTNKQHLEDFGR
jgi:hypothetical protein